MDLGYKGSGNRDSKVIGVSFREVRIISLTN
jgi:hypothetical protein